MEFTRQPIIETVITPKEGCRLILRNSKGLCEDLTVDSVEVVSFGTAIFLRSAERPRTFLLPAIDYEIYETKESKLGIKSVNIERSIKIGGGKVPKESPQEKMETETVSTEEGQEQKGETQEKRRDRRRTRRRRGREELVPEEALATEEKRIEPEALEPPIGKPPISGGTLTTLLPPPSTLISETIARYRENALFKDAFYTKEEEEPEDEGAENISSASGMITEEAIPTAHHPEDLLEALAMQDIALEPSEFGSLGFLNDEDNLWPPPPPLPEEGSSTEEASSPNNSQG